MSDRSHRSPPDCALPIRRALLPAVPAPRPLLVRVLSHLITLLVSFLRMLLGLVIATLSAPVLAPALLMLLPDCVLVRQLERLAVRAVALVTVVAGVKCIAGAKCDSRGYKDPRWAWLAPPVVRGWESPLLHGHRILVYDQPGRWMSDEPLCALYHELRDIAAASMHAVPVHRLFDASALREAYSNRIISVAYDAGGVPLGFTALVYLPYNGSFVIHLGLTMIRESARGRRLQGALIGKCIKLPMLNHCRGSFYLTNIAASPAGIGNVADYFLDAFPHYDQSTECKPLHLDIARHVLRYYRYEFGCSQQAVFDEHTFVVRGSNMVEGGGAFAFIKEDGKPVSRHRNPICNEYVMKTLNLAEGDELFQVARFDVFWVHTKYFMKRRSFSMGKKAS